MYVVSEPFEKDYNKSLNALGIPIQKDPFPISPPSNVDYWANNKNILERIIQAHLDSMMFASNALYVFWGSIGVGKTFAAQYLANPKTKEIVRESFKKDVETLIFRVVAASALKTGQLIYSLYKDIVRNCLNKILSDRKLIQVLNTSHDQIDNEKIKAAFRDIQKAMILTVDGRLNIEKIAMSEGYKLLIQDKSKLGKVQDTNELITIIKFLAWVLLHRFNRIIITIDELENLARGTRAETFLVNDLIRKMHDEVEYGLTLILIFTFDSFDDVRGTLQPSVVDRIRDVIEFNFVEKVSDIKEYIKDCIELRTTKPSKDIIAPEVVTKISENLKTKFQKRVSFRVINKEMHRIFAETFIKAGQPSKYKVDLKLYQSTISLMTPKKFIQRMKVK